MKFWFFNHQSQKVSTSSKLVPLLNLGPREVISVVGGGGKTHTVFEIANELLNLNKKVILCTTTAMMYPNLPVYEGNDVEEIKNLLNGSLVIVGTRMGQKKMGPPDPAVFDLLDSVCDYLVIEADGSRQLPLKFPQSHEPVLHERSSLVIGVAGIDSFGRKLIDVCHRPPTAMKVLHKSEEDIINGEDIAYTLESENGQMKNVQCRFIPILNKVDSVERLNNATHVAMNLKFNDCIFSSYK